MHVCTYVDKYVGTYTLNINLRSINWNPAPHPSAQMKILGTPLNCRNVAYKSLNSTGAVSS